MTRSAVREFQVGYIDEEEARAFAVAGTVAIPRCDMPCIGGVSPVAVVPDIAGELTRGPDLGNVLDNGPRTPPPGSATLREMVAAGVIPRTVTAAQRNSTRDPAHPEPLPVKRGNAHLYDIGEMRTYELSKQRAGSR